MPRKAEMKSDKDGARREAAAELGRFLRGAPFGEDQGGTELYEDRLEREAKEESKEDKQEENERAEMQEDMPALQAGDRAAAKSMQMQGGGMPPPDGDQLAQQAFSEAEDNRQLEVARSTFDVPVFKGELRRRLEARGREGRIMKMMSEGGKAVKRKKR